MRRAIFFLLLLPTILWAQPKPGVFPGEEKRIEDDLKQAKALANEKNWPEAVRRYQQILGEYGDSLAPVDGRRSLPVRWIVHQHLSQLDPAGRKLFRDRVESSAARLVEQGAKDRDWKLLERVVADAFCTRAAEQALHMLGDLAFERGEFDAAGGYWRMLAAPASALMTPQPSEAGFQLVHPDPVGDPALARAKQILALIFSGSTDVAPRELDAFRKLHAQAAGPFAGRKAKYADILQGFLDAPSSQRLPQSVSDGSTWPTFGGSAFRNRTIAGSLTPYWRDVPEWSILLPGDPKAKPHKDADPPTGSIAAARALAFHPVIMAGHVFIADACRVTAYELATGELVSAYDHRKTNGMPKSIDLRLPTRMGIRYTLTAAGNRIYARLGAQPMQPSAEKEPGADDTWIVCLNFDRDADGARLRYRWQLRGRLLDNDPPAMFEGTPVVHAGRLYVARSRFDGRQIITSIDCFDADSLETRAEPPVLRWSVDVWNVDSSASGNGPRHRHELLTMAGSNVVCCTHSGAVIAVDALSGKRSWAIRYPVASRPLIDSIQGRDIAPAVYDSGRLFVAPADADRLFCLDAATGELVWQSSPAHVVHLLGVSSGRLFVTLGGYPHGIRAYDTRRGNPLWTKPDEGDRATFGRGLLTDQTILWPTRFGLKVLHQEDGEPLDAGSSSQPLGNLAFGDGCLIAATNTELMGFVPQRHKIDVLQQDAAQRPDDTLALWRLAKAQAEAGAWDAALNSIVQVEKVAAANETVGGLPIRSATSSLRHARLEQAAGDSWMLGRRDDAIRTLREGLDASFAIADRLRAVLLLRAAGEAIPIEFMEDESLRSYWVTRRDGRPATAFDVLVPLLDEAARSALETRAAQLAKKDFVSAERKFPSTLVVRHGVLNRAIEAERTGNWTEALHRYRQHLAAAALWESDAEMRKNSIDAALHALERGYLRLGQNAAARAIAGFRQSKPTDAPEITPLTGDTQPELPSHWMNRYSVPLKAYEEFPLQPMPGSDEPAAVTHDGLCWFARGDQLVCRSLETGATDWSATVGHAMEQVAARSDTIIVAGPDGVTRLRRHDGLRLWQIKPPDPRPLPTRFPDPPPAVLRLNSTTETFSAFRFAGPRLFFLHGSKLVAVEVETGRVLWQRSAPGAPLSGIGFGEHYLATADGVLMQSTTGAVLLLNAHDGQIVFRRDFEASMWMSSPILADSRTAIVPFDAGHLAAIDMTTGKTNWEQSVPGASSLSGAQPQLRNDGSRFLIVVERNYGFEWELRSLATGRRLLGPIFLGDNRVDLSAAGFSARSYCFPMASRIQTYDRETGATSWTTTLPAAGDWECRATRSDMIVSPRRAIRVAPEAENHASRSRNFAGLPSLRRYHAAMNLLYHGFMDRRWPLMRLDGGSGKVVDSIEFSVRGPRAQLLIGPHHAGVFVEGSLIGLKAK